MVLPFSKDYLSYKRRYFYSHFDSKNSAPTKSGQDQSSYPEFLEAIKKGGDV